MTHIKPVLRLPVAVLAAVAAALPAPVRAETLASIEDEQHALYEQTAPAVVVIASGNTISTGFFAAPGLVVTAAHGVLGERELAVTLRDGRTVLGEVVASSPRGLDLALVRVPVAPERILAPARDAALRAGDVVVAVGHGDGNRWSFSTGIISNAAPDGTDGSLLRLQLGLRPGASGAPVVDRAGRLVGIVVHGDPGTVAFAIRAAAMLRAFPELAEAVAAQPERFATVPAVAVAEEPVLATPLRPPELIVGPADPRPVPSRKARTSAVHAKPAPAVEPPRHVQVRRVSGPPPGPTVGSNLREFVPIAIFATAGLALAALVLGALALASLRGNARAAEPRRRHWRARAPRQFRVRSSPRSPRVPPAPTFRDDPPRAS